MVVGTGWCGAKAGRLMSLEVLCVCAVGVCYVFKGVLKVCEESRWRGV